jgi:hypothetical protein
MPGTSTRTLFLKLSRDPVVPPADTVLLLPFTVDC